MEFELLIPIAPGDVETLKRNLPIIISKVNACQVIVVANKSVREEFDSMDVKFIDEDILVNGLTYNKVAEWIGQRYKKATRRTGWYFQQFLKLGYARVCEHEYYMSWDSDTIPLNKIDFFDEKGRPYLDVLSFTRGDEEYGNTIKNLWKSEVGLPDISHSYITEHMMFNKELVNRMLDEIEGSKFLFGEHFSERIINTISVDALNLSGFSEFQTYATYVLGKYKDRYSVRQWKNLRHGKSYFGDEMTPKQMDWVAKEFDVISFEDFDEQLLYCKIICAEKKIDSRSFKDVYEFVEPFISMKYHIRMIIRKIVRK